MKDKAKFSKKQVEDIIEHHLATNKRLPTAKELAAKIETTAPVAQGFITQFSRAMTKFHVLPNGKVYTTEGEIVWHRNSRGSLVQACYRDGGTLGHIIDG